MADVFRQGGLSSWQEFGLRNEMGVGDEGLTCLANALKASRHSSLRVLTLGNVKLKDVGLRALATAAEEGGCFMHLERLNLNRNTNIIDMEVLSDAIAAGCMPKLADLNVSCRNMVGTSAVALLSILLAHCPKFRTLTLPEEIDVGTLKVIDGLMQNRRSKVLFGW